MSSQQLIANELLAFIKHAIDTMDEVSILQICKSNFKEEDVSSSKKLLYTMLGKLDQMPSRRRDGTEKSIQDIITLMKVTDPDDVPDFVARELHKLPPVTFDHVDVTRLLKDITFLKASLVEVHSKLEISDSTISDLRAEVALLRNAIATNKSPDASNVNMRRGAQNASVGSIVSASSATSSGADTACVAKSAVIAVSTPVKASNCLSGSTAKSAYAAIAATDKKAAPTKLQAGKSKQQRCEPAHENIKQRVPEKATCDKDGFIKVERKKRKLPYPNQCGTGLTGPNMLLRPAIPSTQIYVSRLHHSTKVEEIVEYIQIKTKFTLRVERLESHHNTNFNSFVVRVPTHALETFLKEDFWPKGIVYRRFRGRLHNTGQRNRTP